MGFSPRARRLNPGTCLACFRATCQGNLGRSLSKRLDISLFIGYKPLDWEMVLRETCRGGGRQLIAYEIQPRLHEFIAGVQEQHHRKRTFRGELLWLLRFTSGQL